MSKGRKAIAFKGSEWETVFYNSVGRYVQCINAELAKEIEPEPLSKHIKILGGYAFKSTEYKKQGIPIIRISDFSNERIELSDPAFYKESKELERFELNPGDIVIALTGGTIAKLAIVQSGLGKLYLNQRVGKFEVLNPNEFEAEYIYWIARSVQSIIKSLAWGAAIPNVSPKQIEELEFPFPDRNIQKRIIEFLNDLKNNKIQDNKVYFNEEIENKIIELHTNQLVGKQISNELTHQLDLVKQLRQAFLREAMQGKLVPQDPNDEPASKLLEKIKAEKEQLIKEKKIKKEKELPPIKPEEIPFEVPKNWVWCRLGVVTLFSEAGTSFKALEFIASRGEYGVIKTSAITSGKFLEYENKKLPNQRDDYHLIQIHKNDLLFCRASGSKGLAGKSCLVAFEPQTKLLLSDKSIRFVLSEYISKSYFQFYNSSKYSEEYFLGLGTKKSTTMNNITRGQFYELSIPLPPLAEQHRIVAKLEQLMKYCDDLEQSIKESQKQNEQLLQQVLREALQGKEAEHAV